MCNFFTFGLAAFITLVDHLHAIQSFKEVCRNTLLLRRRCSEPRRDTPHDSKDDVLFRTGPSGKCSGEEEKLVFLANEFQCHRRERRSTSRLSGEGGKSSLRKLLILTKVVYRRRRLLEKSSQVQHHQSIVEDSMTMIPRVDVWF